MKYFGIRGRIILVVVGVIILSTLAAALMVRSLIYQNIVDQKMVSADILTASVVHDIKYDIERKSLSSSANIIISKYMTYYRAINQVQFYDNSSKLLASSKKNGVGTKTTDTHINMAITAAKPSIHTTQANKEQFEIRSISPIMQGSKIIGAVVLDISINDIQETLSAINRRIAIIMLVTVSLAVAVLFFLLRGAVLNRLARLMNMTQEISSGNYKVKIEDRGKDEIGALAHSFNQMTDELCEAKNKIDEHNKQLESKIKEATSEVVAAMHRAEEATQAKSQFLATMSHEIRTPMNGVLGMLYLLGKTELEAKQERLVNTAISSGKVLLSVINDILDFSKLEADKLELESIPFDLEELMQQSVALLAKGAHEKELELICSPDPSMPTQVIGDPTRLRQVLINLIGNAIKFTKQGEVELYARQIEGNNIRIGVRDTGIGMTKNQQEGLFKAFSQADSSTTRKYGGTGLGLAICQKLVGAMGGEILITSTPGLGSDFSFELSLEMAGDGMSEPLFSDVLANQRILIVDDSIPTRKLLKSTLERWQVKQIGLAESGDDALAQLRSAVATDKPYDIAILDKRMPGMDGLELARIIREDTSLTGLKLMMLSGVLMPTPIPEFDAYINKPILHTDLFIALLKLLGEQREEAIQSNQIDIAMDGWFGDSKLLLVEDNQVNQEVAKAILSDVGFNIDVVENGLEAVSAVQEYDYDVVLMDIQMPVMDGLEATRQIRGLGGHFTRLPIIAMTANALSNDADKSLSAGMNGHITKPIDPVELFQALAHWVTPGEAPLETEKATATVDHADVEVLPELPGIDVAEGLQRMCGNWEAYKSILIGFRNKHADASELLEKYIRQGEWDNAVRLAHTLKGSSGNISANDLYETATVVEQSCRKEDVDVASAKLRALQLSLEEVINGLAKLENISTREAIDVAPGEFDLTEGCALLEQFVSFIDTDFVEAESRLKSLRQLVAGGDYSTSLDELEKALNNFDTDAAKTITQRVQSHWKNVIKNDVKTRE